MFMFQYVIFYVQNPQLTRVLVSHPDYNCLP